VKRREEKRREEKRKERERARESPRGDSYKCAIFFTEVGLGS